MDLKGFKTLIVGLLLAIVPVALQYLAGIDWAQYVGPQTAFFISGAIMMVMRFFTTTPVAQAKPDKKV